MEVLRGDTVIPFVSRYATGTQARHVRAGYTGPTAGETRDQYLMRTGQLASPKLTETQIRQKLENGTLNRFDVDNAPNEALSAAIYRYLQGLPWEYSWSNTTVPVTPTTPTPTTTPTQPMNPQVIWYDPGVWKSNPTLAYVNNTGGQSINKFSGLGKFSSYDPATETTLQAPEKMNAYTLMQIDQDPVRRDFTESVYNRHNRSWEKELADAIRAAPMGNATSYVRNG